MAYGDVPADRARLDGLCPVVASYGGKDRVVGRKMAERLERHLAALGVPHDVKTYDHAGHSFFSQVDGWRGWLARVPRRWRSATTRRPRTTAGSGCSRSSISTFR